MLRTLCVASVLTLCSGGMALAEEGQLQLSGSMRLRYETVEGQVRPGFNASDSLTNLRTTLSGEYRRGAFRIGGDLYDSRAWGGDAKTPIGAGEVNTLEPVQAYVGWSGKSAVLGATSVQVGRLMLNLGSRRLIAADEYRNTTSSYDGVRVDFAPGGIVTTLIYMRPVIRLPDALGDILDNRQHPDRSSAALQLWGGLAAKPHALGRATLEGTYFHFEERDSLGRPTRDRSLDTFGGRIIADPKAGAWDYEFEALAQTGSISRGLSPRDAKQSVRAGFAHGGVGYTWARPWSPHATALFDLVTGDRSGDHYARFDTLYGMRRGDFAPAGLYNAIGRANLVSTGLRLDVAPNKAWDAFVSVRGFWLESRRDSFSTTGVRDVTGRSGNYAGTQLDTRVRRWIVKDQLRAEFDGVWLAKGDVLTKAPNAPRTGKTERYLSFNLTTFF